jgi:hypothetical protein
MFKSRIIFVRLDSRWVHHGSLNPFGLKLALRHPLQSVLSVD